MADGPGVQPGLSVATAAIKLTLGVRESQSLELLRTLEDTHCRAPNERRQELCPRRQRQALPQPQYLRPTALVGVLGFVVFSVGLSVSFYPHLAFLFLFLHLPVFSSFCQKKKKMYVLVSNPRGSSAVAVGSEMCREGPPMRAWDSQNESLLLF